MLEPGEEVQTSDLADSGQTYEPFQYRTQALAERGYDAERVDAQIAADKKRERALGLTLSSPAPSPIVEQTDQSPAA